MLFPNSVAITFKWDDAQFATIDRWINGADRAAAAGVTSDLGKSATALEDAMKAATPAT
jgi:hypothetical protein